MAKLIDTFIKKIDPDVRTEQGGVLNQIFANLAKKGERKVVEGIYSLMPEGSPRKERMKTELFPTTQPTAQPVKPTIAPLMPTTKPTMQPQTVRPTQGGFNIPNVPPQIAQIIGQVFSEQGSPMDATQAAQILSHPKSKQVGGDIGLGENPQFATDLDIPNRISPKTGKWDNNAPIKKILNPFTGKKEDSIDRGLWRINNGTFYDYLKRMPDLLSQHGITEWEDMRDPYKNTVMAKIILQKQGPRAWFAAPDKM